MPDKNQNTGLETKKNNNPLKKITKCNLLFERKIKQKKLQTN